MRPFLVTGKRIEGEGNIGPRWTWRSKLVHWFMVRDPKYTIAAVGGDGEGRLALVIMNSKEEIIAESVMEPHVLTALKEQLEAAEARVKLVKE